MTKIIPINGLGLVLVTYIHASMHHLLCMAAKGWITMNNTNTHKHTIANSR